MNRTRLVRFWPYAAAIGALVAAVAMFVAFKPQTALELWSWAWGVAQAKWRGGQLLFFTAVAIVIELFFLSWEKTTVFRVFVRRSASAVTDACFALVTFSSFKWLTDYVFSLGVAFAAVKLGDALSTNLGWLHWRWEMPSDGFLEVAFAFTVYFLMSTFVGYWQHRLMHWGPFWQLHRFHHAATDYNIFTGFRANPAEMISNLIPALSPLALLKVPDAGLFAAFVFANQALGSFQHSELQWNFGWFGRWIVVSPPVHQIHHSIDAEHRDRNFSNCPLWDKMFGTWYGGPSRPSAYGIADQAHVERPAIQWLIDIWIFYRDITLALAGLARRGWVRIVRTPIRTRAAETPASIPAE
jgi:sterol desaturase/sphingolipid hydroxylase (fatty acid hydroxylase superfamily)